MYWSEADMEEKRRKGGKAKAAINSGNVNSHGGVLVGSIGHGVIKFYRLYGGENVNERITGASNA